MSIFASIGYGVLIALVPVMCLCIPFFACDVLAHHPRWIATIMIGSFILTLLLTVFIGIGVVTEDERVFVSKYEAQKATLECSLDSEELTGLERIQLVNKAVELNGELAERKARCARWHVVLYDNSIYDNVEPIKFD